MSVDVAENCILLPAGGGRPWILPQCCLGEIVTVAAEGECPPETIDWRGEEIPVVDFDAVGGEPWRDPRGVSGLIAVVLGLREEDCPYFGLALRGSCLGVVRLAEAEMQDIADEQPSPYTLAAFRLGEQEYAVPDLHAVQRAVGSGAAVSGNAAPVTVGYME